MIKYVFFLLIPCLLASPVRADAVDVPHNWFTSNTYTHTYQLELKPASLNPKGTFKTASVCFLGVGDCGTGGGFDKSDGLDIDTANQCKNEGYTVTSCNVPEYLNGECPYNSSYFSGCVSDTDRACTDLGFVKACSDNEKPNTSSVCEYNSNYFKCSCAPCDGFDYTHAQATADGYLADGSCQSCNETRYKRKCAPCDGYNYTYEEATAEGYVPDGSCKSCETTMYKRKENPCTGFMPCECGGEIGAQSCKSGSTTLYKTCKSCCENKCTEATCPTGTVCTYEACSQKYCPTGCDVNYSEWCTTPITDCGTLGYTKSPSECVGSYLKCPYGEGVFCKEPCDGVIDVGSIVYADDKICSNVIEGREPIAVVYDPALRLAAALHPSTTTMQWGVNGSADIPDLYNCYTTDDDTYVFRCATNGKDNTAKILAFGETNNLKFAAAEFCNTYAVGGKPHGTWYLPSMKELYNLYLNISTVNFTRKALGLAPLGEDKYKSTFWSSNKFQSFGAWHVYWPDTKPVNTGKYENRDVLPVMQY